MSRAYDPDDTDQVAERQADATRRGQQRDADWRWLLAAPQGRRILAELLAASGLMGIVVSDSHAAMAYAQGRRSIGGEIYARLTHIAESENLPALLAEVLVPPDVRRERRNDRDASR